MEYNCYLIDIQKLKKSKDKTGGKNAYRKKRKEKKRKEKKSKGLFYLIFTLTIIAALTISCKNKPTGSNEFAWEDVDIKVPVNSSGKHEMTKDNWKNLLKGRTIISESTIPITADGFGMAYFFGEFTDDGFKWGTSSSLDTPPAYNRGTVSLSGDFFDGNKANFTGQDDSGKIQQEGQIVFTVDQNTGSITDVTVKFTKGTTDYDGKEIKCGMPKEPR